MDSQNSNYKNTKSNLINHLNEKDLAAPSKKKTNGDSSLLGSNNHPSTNEPLVISKLDTMLL